jgi:hypothetical protein
MGHPYPGADRNCVAGGDHPFRAGRPLTVSLVPMKFRALACISRRGPTYSAHFRKILRATMAG